MMQKKHNLVRVRFAPSPTGPLHLGGIRTALYNYLFAKKYGGSFILRIEDTDRKRFVPNSESYIMETLKWCQIEPDEGVGYGGVHLPYHQSQRGDIYRFHLSKLLDKGHAYYAFDTDEELYIKKKEYQNRGLTFSYNASIRMGMNNSLTMTKKQLYTKLNSGFSYVIRFKIPPGEKLKMEDMIRGNIVVNTDSLDDKILLKSNGIATYHLANTIDDHLMKITHVIRGEEWLPSMSLHLLLYRAFGWIPPSFAHLPLILREDGKGKLSKRNVENLDFPIFPLQWQVPETKTIIPGYRELGYFPEAFVNMLALLGWNPGIQREILSLQELINFFSLKRITKSGVYFNLKKANWFNKQYLKKKRGEIFSYLSIELQKRSISYEIDYLYKVIHLTIDRLHFVHEIWEHSFYFFISPNSYESSSFNQIFHQNIIDQLESCKKSLLNIPQFTSVNLRLLFQKYNQKNRHKMMKIFRLALVGSLKGTDLFMIFEMLGKKESIQRIEKLMKKIRENI
ncbi:glutamyl-tRNA synthetase [Blattabacterium sp. (Periplaneta americana) str. BPLAN]|uniref:glutamate--tRNA ligase n=1 Tax=Blattabacterium sp. (Periplaneta americana) TaxID=367488 RepID=UPI0001BA0C1F|nr:glutamate--tRNA ligase [Blattabacterium sp. (Periplaneta americana)]ACX83929.1 glutamyl-tRNA synthetase [Blattabacterium sp. (Periplaneta americana) str. BPLAN]